MGLWLPYPPVSVHPLLILTVHCKFCTARDVDVKVLKREFIVDAIRLRCQPPFHSGVTAGQGLSGCKRPKWLPLRLQLRGWFVFFCFVLKSPSEVNSNVVCTAARSRKVAVLGVADCPSSM